MILKQSYFHNDVKVIGKEQVYRDFFQINKYQFQFKRFDGEWSELVNRECFERGQASAVILYDPKLDQVVLQEQVRVGALQDSLSPWLFEVVAGVIEEGETPEAVAKREAYEEAGCVIDELIPIANYYSSPGGTSEYVHLFYAPVDSRKACGIHGCEHEMEDIKVHVLPRQQAYQALLNGEINNATAVIALQWLQLNYQSLK